MLLASAVLAVLPQSPAVAKARPTNAPTAPVEVALRVPGDDDTAQLRWSPKGAKVALTKDGDALVGSFPLGHADAAPVRVRLVRTDGGARVDRLLIDLDRDGRFGADESLSTTPNERRGKWWSSFSTVVDVPTRPAPPGEVATTTTRPYPMSLWFVEDPREPDAEPALRWSRRGFRIGSVDLGGEPAWALLTESRMDGVFTKADAWMLARDQADLGRSSRPVGGHCWLDGTAYRVTALDPDGKSLTFEAFDPGFTEAEEQARNDTTRPDREAARAEKPLAFGHDLAAALATAKRDGRKVFVDFETTWCGPCKVMDQLVYTSKAVVDAAAKAKVLCVKVDGDEHRELVKKYAVAGYPTMLLLDGDGEVLAREVGYRSVAAMAAFLAK